jgi:arylsulfatase A-like enzyme
LGIGRLTALELKVAGYQIGFVGKWGVANPMPTDAFDYFDGFDDQGKYFDENFGEGHLTQNLAKSAVKAIDHFDELDKPYMLMVSFKAPHGQKDLPFTKSPDMTLDYPEFDFSVHTSWPKNVSNFSSLPEFLKQSAGRDAYLNTLRGEQGYQNYLQAYARLICGVDKAVGAVLNRATETTDMSELEVLHLSDNGMMMGEYGLFGKYLMYEDSIKIPFIWKPSKFSAHSEKLQESLVLNIDVAPTLLAAAGVKAPKAYQGIALQDLSTTVQRSDFFYSFYVTHDGRIPVCLGLRGKRYKYVEYPEHEYQQLFDLERDPEELENLVGNTKHTAELNSMKTKMEQCRKQAGPLVPAHS